jgi:hypothetical protein
MVAYQVHSYCASASGEFSEEIMSPGSKVTGDGPFRYAAFTYLSYLKPSFLGV